MPLGVSLFFTGNAVLENAVTAPSFNILLRFRVVETATIGGREVFFVIILRFLNSSFFFGCE